MVRIQRVSIWSSLIDFFSQIHREILIFSDGVEAQTLKDVSEFKQVGVIPNAQKHTKVFTHQNKIWQICNI